MSLKLHVLLLVMFIVFSYLNCCIFTYIFCKGTLSDMPAVNTFAMYAAVAVLVDFILQITAFIALLSLDDKRYKVSVHNLQNTNIKNYQ